MKKWWITSNENDDGRLKPPINSIFAILFFAHSRHKIFTWEILVDDKNDDRLDFYYVCMSSSCQKVDLIKIEDFSGSIYGISVNFCGEEDGNA